MEVPAVHKVICDGCNADPIRGVRYKCPICPDYDLCQSCFKLGVHKHKWMMALAAPEPELVCHTGVRCDGCGEKPIRGVRFKCDACPDYDLCQKCFEAKKHSDCPSHTYTPFTEPPAKKSDSVAKKRDRPPAYGEDEKGEEPGAAKRLKSALEQIAADGALSALAKFGVRLLDKLEEKTHNNIAISPYSIFRALMALTCGARGETREQLLALLESTDLDKLAKNLNEVIGDHLTATQEFNAFWSRFKLDATFVRRVEQTTGCEVNEGKDFDAKVINELVAKATKDCIKKLVEHVGPDERALILNAVYFRAPWATQFDPKKTKPDAFYSHAEASYHYTSFMHHTFDKVAIATVRVQGKYTFEALALPYGTPQTAAIFILPKYDLAGAIVPGVHLDGLPLYQIYDSLLNKGTGKIDGTFYSPSLDIDVSREKVAVAIPKFALAPTPITLNEVLKSLGATDMFGEKANFGDMTRQADLYVSKVVHACLFEVNEKETKVAAATAVMMREKCMVKKPMWREFICDRPFAMAVFERGILVGLTIINRSPETL